MIIMRKLQLQTPHFIDYLKHFSRWLRIIGMNHISVYSFPAHIRELLHFCENIGIYDIELLTPTILRQYFHYLSTRSHQFSGGSLSKASLNKHLQAIKKFSSFLWKTQRLRLTVTIKPQVITDAKKTIILSPNEIACLYDACEHDSLLEFRDKIMLDLYYGCGLRRSEGIKVLITDVDLTNRSIYVRHGKNYTQRYIPLTQSICARLSHYIFKIRPQLLKSDSIPHLLITKFGFPLGPHAAYDRLKTLQFKSDCESIKIKEFGLHTLRHSIATHLLHKGLPLKQIAQFLGHKSLESTQIYTKLIHEL